MKNQTSKKRSYTISAKALENKAKRRQDKLNETQITLDGEHYHGEGYLTTLFRHAGFSDYQIRTMLEKFKERQHGLCEGFVVESRKYTM